MRGNEWMVFKYNIHDIFTQQKAGFAPAHYVNRCCTSFVFYFGLLFSVLLFSEWKNCNFYVEHVG